MSAQSALEPAGAQAARLCAHWWLFFGITAAVYLLVGGTILFILLRRRHAPPETDFSGTGSPRPPGVDAALGRRVAGATAVTAATLVGLLIASAITSNNQAAYGANPDLAIQVIGHQWWWEVRYPDRDPSRLVVTANELHIPVRRRVLLRLQSDDVIHSFWVPNLHGKRDLIPGRDNRLVIESDRPGVFRGQCAEYCGGQHAHMALLVIAENDLQFTAWRNQQLNPAREPADPAQQRGRTVFLNAPCILCHAIRGTPANGQTGPDLTHLAARRTIAAGTLPNVPGNLAGWIANAQSIKPGNHMPPMHLAPDDLQALLAYMTSLQ